MTYKSYISMMKKGGIGVLPTDTIYGLVGSALSKKTVERIYKLRRRNSRKPMIILIGSLAQLKLFGITPKKETAKLLQVIWSGSKPGPKQHPDILKYLRMLFSGKGGRRPTSVILPVNSQRVVQEFRYLHRGTKTLAFRLPKPHWLRKLLARAGPLVAPSANPEGMTPARTIGEAKRYFGEGVDFYVNAGKIAGRPSKLIRIASGKTKVLRK